MITNYFAHQINQLFLQVRDLNQRRAALAITIILAFSFAGFGQSGNGVKDITIRWCSESIGNGLYAVNFSYDNPNKKEVVVPEDDSYVVSNKGKGKAKGLNKFQPGLNEKVFTRVISEHEEVEWTVINPNGNVHTVHASANSSHCPEGYSGDIFPLFGNGSGKEINQLGVELQALVEGSAGNEPTDLVFQINDEQEILLEIVPREDRMFDLINLLRNTFSRAYEANSPNSDFLVDPQDILDNGMSAVDVYFYIPRLMELINYADIINFARPVYPSYKNMGIVTSEGDAAQYSDIVRESFRFVSGGAVVPVDGTGVKIGVISDSYDTQPYTGNSKATVDVAAGDLPGANGTNPVQLLQDFPYGPASDEGRAMMHIIHDVAPGADLAFHTGVISPRNFELAIEALDLAGCSIIVDDITFPGEPFFGLGNIAETIQRFADKPGRFYFTSSGNFADNGYSAMFNTSSAAPVTNFLNSSVPRAHVFGTNPDGTQDMFQKIRVAPGTYFIALQWAEGLASQENNTGAITDLDIYLVDDQGQLIVGNNRVNDDGDPTEFLVFQARADAEANIMITSVNGPPPPGLAIRYIAFRAQGMEFLEYGHGPTVSGHAMTPEAITVGAVDYRDAASPIAEYFSSYGGELPDMTAAQVDLSAPDGVNTNVNSVGVDIDSDGYTNFFGTSAAAPHAAGAFALLMSALPSWYPDGLPEAVSSKSLLSEQVLDLFQRTAVPAGPAEVAGAGLIQTENVFKSLAAQTASITALHIEEGKTPSAEPFEVTIVGDFLPAEPFVVFDGDTLEIVSVSETEIVAKVPRFYGNPALVVYTEPKTPGGTDGGDSDPAYFFEGDKIAFDVIADDISIVFGQDVLMDYTTVGITKEELASKGLPEISITALGAVLPYPDVNNYVLEIGFEAALTPEQEELFQVNFINGELQVTRNDLDITPMNAVYTYGDPMDFTMQYTFNEEGISDSAAFLNAIMSAHDGDYFDSQNSLIQVNDFGKIKVLGEVNSEEFINFFAGTSWMTSAQIVSDIKLKALANGMNMVELDAEHFQDYYDYYTNAVSGDIKVRALPNAVDGDIKVRCIANTFDFLSNNLNMVFENAVSGDIKVRPLANGTGLENFENNYDSMFAVIDFDDGSTETEERSVEVLYAMDMVTGLTVTSGEEKHYIFPGAFLSAMASNFNVTYGYGELTILPASLTVATGDLVIQQGEEIDTSLIGSTFDGFVYGEDVASIYPEGIPYYYVNNSGEIYETGDIGVYDILIQNPANYAISYSSIGKLYVNPSGNNLKKVRTSLDCIEENPGAANGMFYLAHFSYENPNAETIYVLLGEDNYLTGEAMFEGEPPIMFLPGKGTFTIPFDGQKLIWNLTTFESTHKSSVSSEATKDSGKCDAKDVITGTETTDFNLYPNPFENSFSVERNVEESGTIYVYNIYGVQMKSVSFTKNEGSLIPVDMTGYPSGWYIVRISTVGELYSFTVSKQ